MLKRNKNYVILTLLNSEGKKLNRTITREFD